MITTVAWLEWYLSRLMPCLFSYVLSQWRSQSSESVLSAVIGVFLSVCVCSETLPSPKLGRSFSVCVCVCLPPSFSHSLSLTRSFLSLFTSPLNVCLFPPPPFFSLSPPTGAVCIPARRGGGVCDPGSIRTRPPRHATLPRVHPHPLPGKMGAPSSLAGHRLPFECAASRGSRDLTWFVCLLLRVCTKP